MVDVFLLIAVLLQGVAVVYGVVLAARRQGAPWAWLFLVGAMLSMLTWRVVMATGAHPPAYFTPLIALWGSSTMFVAMWLFDREIARRMRAEAERDALLTSERLARSDAERASQLKDEFLATLSHELRTPLAAVLGWCAVVRHAKDRPAEVAAGIDTIERNARAQARLVDDLLEVTRMSAGMLDLERSPVRLDEPVRASIEAARVSAEAKGVGLALLGGPAFPRVLGDAGRLQQIVGNLLTNAVKFTPAGGRVTVQIGEADGRAAVVVADTGEGIDPAFLPHLFGRFRQADSSTRRRHGGLGLGLSIVDHLVRLHGGEVRAASPGPGGGATFTVELPALREPGPGAHPTDPDPVEAEVRLTDVRVLVVDDEADVREAVSRMLVQRGAQVTALASGREVERVLAEFRPDVLLVDISMPDEDGYGLIRRVRSLPPGAGGGTPALSLTAHARDADRARALAAGFQGHLAKPVDLGGLVAAIRAQVRAGAAAEAPAQPGDGSRG